MNKHIGHFVKLRFSKMKPICGLILDYNRDWILMRNIPVDYVIDGYIIVRNKNIKEITHGEDEKWHEKIIYFKSRKIKSVNIPTNNLEDILKYLTRYYKVFTLYTKKQGVCWLGKLNAIDSRSVTIADLTPKAKWDGEVIFRPSEITAIEFDTDYINSLKLVMT